MADIYKEIILDHYRHPRNYGRIKKPDFYAKEENIFCGDNVEISGRVVKGRVKDIKFRGAGCIISQASASILSEYARGYLVKSAQKIKIHVIIMRLGIRLTPTRIRCAELPIVALRSALQNWEHKKSKQ